MANVKVYNIEGKEVGTIELNDAIFGVEVNEHLMHMAVVQQLANKRQGTQKAKTRSEVSGGGRKPWRQKGTGHARQGSTRSPQWTGGGVVFAPTPRDYSFKLNKKEKRAALKSALSSRVEKNKFIVVDEMNFGEIKTKNFQTMLNNLSVAKALIVFVPAVLTPSIFLADNAAFVLPSSNTTNAFATDKLFNIAWKFFVLISSNFNSSTTMNLFSCTLDVSADLRAALFSFLFNLKE